MHARILLLLAFTFALLTAQANADPPAGQAVGPHHVGCNVSEMFGEHLHAHLAIYRNGTPVEVPANIGFVQTAGVVLCLYWLHTHDDTGLIHVEAPGGNYTLADFFAVWGEPLSSTRIGRYTGHVRANVNGAPFKGAPQSIPLRDNETITLWI
jgi:hypothetical protein